MSLVPNWDNNKLSQVLYKLQRKASWQICQTYNVNPPSDLVSAPTACSLWSSINNLLVIYGAINHRYPSSTHVLKCSMWFTPSVEALLYGVMVRTSFTQTDADIQHMHSCKHKQVNKGKFTLVTYSKTPTQGDLWKVDVASSPTASNWQSSEGHSKDLWDRKCGP